MSLVPWFCDSQNDGPECDGKSVLGTGSHSETDGDTREIDEIDSDTAGSRDIDGLRGRRMTEAELVKVTQMEMVEVVGT